MTHTEESIFVQQAKTFILDQLKSAPEGIEEIIYPCYQIDFSDYIQALNLPDVQAEFKRRNIKGVVHPVESSRPQIIIATHQQVVDGTLQAYLDSEVIDIQSAIRIDG